MDFGNILDQFKIEINEKIIYSELHSILSSIGSKRCLFVLKNIDHLRLTKKENKEISIHANKIYKNDGNLNFNEPKLIIFNKWRAFGDNITLFSFFRNKRIIFRFIEYPIFNNNNIDSTNDSDDINHNNLKNGSFLLKNEILKIKVFDGWLNCSKIQIEGLKISSISKLKKEFKIQEGEIYQFDREIDGISKKNERY